MSLLDHELDNLSTARLRELAADRATSPTVQAAVETLLAERAAHAAAGEAFLRKNFTARPAL